MPAKGALRGRLRWGRLAVYLDVRDLWVGVFRGDDAVYVCPLPMLVLRFQRGWPR